jgi:hypothetical protein
MAMLALYQGLRTLNEYMAVFKVEFANLALTLKV